MADTPTFHTLMNFKISPESWTKVKDAFVGVLKKFLGTVLSENWIQAPDCAILFLVGSHQITLRFFDHGFLTVDVIAASSVPFPKGKQEYGEVTKKLGRDLEKVLEEAKLDLGTNDILVLPPITRGGKINPFVPTTDERIVEYDFLRVLHEEDSPFQNIKVYESFLYGPMLILDDDPNMSPADVCYTRAIMGNGKENFKDKRVLILGGGDGNLLTLLRKEKPKEIIMLEIDQAVLNVAKKYLRAICEDSLDSHSGENYKIIMGDCTIALQKFIETGETFDYIINDLTAIPVGEFSSNKQAMGETWDFLRLILDFSIKLLAPGGIYLAQGNGQSNVVELDLYENCLRNLSCKVAWERLQDICVPSYLELWVFFKVWKI